MRTLIIDDEPLARQRIRRLLENWPDITNAGECRNGTEAIAAIREERPDFIFLDIQMKDMNGFEVLEAVPAAERPLVIFVTAFDEYAIRAFDVFAFDYLLKPFQDERFHQSVERAVEHLQRDSAPTHAVQLEALLQHLRRPANTMFPLREGSRVSFVSYDEICHVTASGSYCEIFTTQKRHLVRTTLAQLQDELEPYGFVRIHRSTIINPRFLAELNHVPSGDLEVRLRDGQRMRVSKSHRDGLLKALRLV